MALDPRSDPLVVLNQLDNDDKHRLMNVSFGYPGELQGLELVEILDPQRIRRRQNLWSAPQRLEHGTPIARFFTTGRLGPTSFARATTRASDTPLGTSNAGAQNSPR
jgi:hypothetical protein